MYNKITLPNGVRVVADKMTSVRSASLGVFIDVGSRHETEPFFGAAHFIEHMVFKGTHTRSAEHLAQFMDAVGGRVNAGTAHDSTVFYGTVIDSRLGELAEVLADMTLNSLLDEADVDAERTVIFEEIDMYEDSPENVVSERLHNEIFGGSSLSHNILGTRESLAALTSDALREFMRTHYVGGAMVIASDALREFMRTHYVGGAMVIALAGNYSDADLAKICDVFSAIPSGAAPTPLAAQYKTANVTTSKDIEQVHLSLAFPGLSYGEDRRGRALRMLSSILGGGMSSRLFQEVREKRGLCYGIYSQASGFADTGVVTINTATNRDAQDEMLSVILAEIARIRDLGVTSDELGRELEQITANVLMSLESSMARMMSCGNNELRRRPILTTDELLACYESVAAQELRDIASELLRTEMMSMSVLGRGVEM